MRTLPLASLVPYARNARTHSEAQVAQIAASITEFGFTNPILADARGIVAGHGRVLGAALLYGKGQRITLPGGGLLPEGTVPVIDCTGWTDAQRRAYIIADNQLALQAGWNVDLLKGELEDLKAEEFDLSILGFPEDELKAILDSVNGELSTEQFTTEYTTRIETPIYTPKGEKPSLDALCSQDRARQLLAGIESSSLPEHEKAFLRIAAVRHIVFDYHAIAEYYCHASPEAQRLMEDSALVIIDVKRAIELGYVELSRRLESIFADTYGTAGDDTDEDDH